MVIQKKTMKEVAASLLILLVDTALWVVLWGGLVLLRCSSCGGLAGLWAFGAAKWAALHTFTSIVTDGRTRQVLRRLVALLCLLPAVTESGRMLLTPPSEPFTEPPPDLSVVLVGSLSSSLACWMWEKGIVGDGNHNHKQEARRVLIRMLMYFRPDIFHLIAAFSFLILCVLCDTSIPFYQGKVIDMLRSHVLHANFCFVIGQRALVDLGSALFSGLRGGTFKFVLARLNKRMRHLLFHTLLRQEVHFFEENSPGRLSSRLHSDVEKMGRTVALNANALVRSTVNAFLTLAMMLQLSGRLTALVCPVILLQAVLQRKYYTVFTELNAQMQECTAQNTEFALQTLSGIQTVRSCNAQEDEVSRYDRALEQMRIVKLRSRIYGLMLTFARRLLSLAMTVLMLFQARSLISSGQLSIGTLVTFVLYQKPMLTNLTEILRSCVDTASTVGVISKVFTYLDRTPKCTKSGELAPAMLEGRVVFKNVSLTYPSADQPALRSVSMELKPGTMTALVGPSGGGKTSCVSLLKRLYEPQEGHILLDGEPLHRYTHRYLHEKVAVVSQNPVLFSGSLAYNITYGLTDCSAPRVKEAARMADADGFISEMEKGYDTDVGEGGAKLSEGQKQCIAVIRALVREPRVIILDEATSSLDVDTQHKVLRAIRSTGRTILLVAHQLKTVEKADHIVFLENGVVVEEGTHQELMANRGRYRRLQEELFSPVI